MRIVCIIFLSTFYFQCNAQTNVENKTLWTFTYLKATEGQKADLKLFLEQNWLAMDKIATAQGLFKQFHLLENNDASKDWDFTVVVQYQNEKGYEGVKVEFEKIRQAHKRVLINGKGMGELGKIVKSEEMQETR
jgi:hypothetical protein